MEGVAQTMAAALPWLGTFVSGTLFGGVVMALLNFQLDGAKSRRARRLTLIEKARSDLLRGPDGSSHWTPYQFHYYIQGTEAWAEIIPHLSNAFLQKFKAAESEMKSGNFEVDYIENLKLELGRIEKRWKLI